jgi:leader peptidase (prepilin peptidase) / N-methyltransferase
MESCFSIFLFVIGACIGSFLNVCIYRLPLNRSIVMPGSFCFSCKSPIKPFDNIPILSFIFLLGKCRRCGSLISFQYPFVEFATASLFVIFYRISGFDLKHLVVNPSSILILIGMFFYIGAMVVITMIDLKHQIIPDSISIPGIVLGLIFTLYRVYINDTSRFILSADLFDSFFGGALGALIFYLIIVISRGGMGYGDVKLSAMIGTFMGWRVLLVVIMLSVISGSIIGIYLRLTGKNKPREPIPFGPFLAIMSLVCLVYGKNILDWYINLMF